VLLHFGAVDHEATIWVDGVEVGRHRGGFASFTVDITDAVTPRLEAAMVVRARDEALGPQARGKQSRTYTPVGPDYWHTTGIWQTVWLEPVPQVALRRPRITPNLAGRSFDIVGPMTENLPGGSVVVTVVDLSGVVVWTEIRADLDLAPRTSMVLPEDRVRLWSTADPFLYDVRFDLREERYLYHADRLGYLVWGEYGDWGSNTGLGEVTNQQPTAAFIQEWLEIVERDYSHPSILGWCPLNETWQAYGDRITPLDDVLHGMFLATKALDTSRLAEGQPFVNRSDLTGDSWSIPYRGQPFFVSEFGGIWWNPSAIDRPETPTESWGYGDRVRSVKEFYERLEGLTAVLLDHPRMFGYCYTRLTDVFQEQNGIYGFDRSEKFDLARIRGAQLRPAAVETLRTTRRTPEAAASRGQ